MATEDYGNLYWCVTVTPEISKDGEIYLQADRPEITEGGDLIMIGHNSKGVLPVLVISRGQWRSFFAASVMDGSPVAVDHWADVIKKG